MPSERLIPLAAMEQLMRNAGAQRVSEEAKMALKELLEKQGIELTKKAITLAEHAGRKTLKADDVKLAFEQ